VPQISSSSLHLPTDFQEADDSQMSNPTIARSPTAQGCFGGLS